MVVAGVLIKTAPGTTKQVIERLRQTEGTRYDIVTMIKDVKDRRRNLDRDIDCCKYLMALK
jgi:hypothetical protein